MNAGAVSKWITEKNVFRGFADITAIIFTFLVFAFIYLLVPPVKQGFFCDDKTLMKPYKPDMIPMWLLGVYGGICPIILFFIFELFVSCPLHPNNSYDRQRLYFGSIFHITLLFLYGGSVTFLITEVGKRSIGKLRPHFLTVCKPDWTKIQCYEAVHSNDGNTHYLPKYVTEYTCLGPNRSLILEAKISFPSGHSSLSSFSFIFLLVYLEARCCCRYIRFFKPILQTGCVCIALFTCLSRIADNKHHPTDVLAGASIGIAVALFLTLRTEKVLWNYGFYDRTSARKNDDELLQQKDVWIM